MNVGGGGGGGSGVAIMRVMMKCTSGMNILLHAAFLANTIYDLTLHKGKFTYGWWWSCFGWWRWKTNSAQKCGGCGSFGSLRGEKGNMIFGIWYIYDDNRTALE